MSCSLQKINNGMYRVLEIPQYFKLSNADKKILFHPLFDADHYYLLYTI